ncbi:MAG: hypothetical protein CMK06_01970 [Ponticaulis sp.]|nr:hypothetical protein [Ponticaulis sp.]
MLGVSEGQVMKRFLYACVTLALVALISWGAMTAIPPIPKIVPHQDKLEHVLAFGALTLWLTVLFGPRRISWTVVLASGGALALEISQGLFSDKREGDIADLSASLFGIAMAGLSLLALRELIRRRQRAIAR